MPQPEADRRAARSDRRGARRLTPRPAAGPWAVGGGSIGHDRLNKPAEAAR